MTRGEKKKTVRVLYADATQTFFKNTRIPNSFFFFLFISLFRNLEFNEDRPFYNIGCGVKTDYFIEKIYSTKYY